MNNNDWNNPNNINNQYNGSNNQPINNNLYNMSNQFNNTNSFQNNNVENTNYTNGFNSTNINNQSNLYNDNPMNQVETPKKKINTKLFAIIVGIIIVIVIVIVIISKELGSNENTTGSTEYKGSDVDYNCTYEYTNEDKKMKVYSDFIFNYKSTSESGKHSNYQLKIYNKMIIEYGNRLTDSRYKDFVDSFESLECLGFGDEEKCTESHLELGITDLGWDTVVDRIGDKIEVTYYNIYGMGTTATKKNMKEIIEKYESNGYICK